MLYHVKDMSPEQRQAAEVLLGHPVSDAGVIEVECVQPADITPSPLSPGERIDSLRALETLFAANPCAEVSAEEENELVSEAFRSVRTESRPVS